LRLEAELFVQIGRWAVMRMGIECIEREFGAVGERDAGQTTVLLLDMGELAVENPHSTLLKLVPLFIDDLVTVEDEGNVVGPVRIKRWRVQGHGRRIKEPPAFPGHFITMAEGAMDHSLSPGFGKAGDSREFINNSVGQDQPAATDGWSIGGGHGEIVRLA